jgi:hypothetical protein
MRARFGTASMIQDRSEPQLSGSLDGREQAFQTEVSFKGRQVDRVRVLRRSEGAPVLATISGFGPAATYKGVSVNGDNCVADAYSNDAVLASFTHNTKVPGFGTLSVACRQVLSDGSTQAFFISYADGTRPCVRMEHSATSVTIVAEAGCPATVYAMVPTRNGRHDLHMLCRQSSGAPLRIDVSL